MPGTSWAWTTATSLEVYAKNVSDVDNVTALIQYYHNDLRATSYMDQSAMASEFMKRQQERQIQQLEEQQATQIEELETARDEQVAQLNTSKNAQITNYTSTQKDKVAQLKDDQKQIGIIGDIIMFVSMGGGIVIVLFLMLYTTKERTKEIGTLKALGFSKGNIMMQIITEGIMFGLLGGAAGTALGWIAAPILSRLFFAAQDSNVISFPTLQVSLMAIGLIAFLSALGSLYPAFMASRLSPVEAMRHE